MSFQPPVLIIEARFYPKIADAMVTGAVKILKAAGYKYERLEVPGVFEIPAAITMALKSGDAQAKPDPYPGIIAFGCVIRGETDHYDHVCRESSRALMELTTKHILAFGFGVLTCENREQAEARAAVDGKNKGSEAAEACIRMMEIKRQFGLI